MLITLQHYLILAAFLFVCGLLTILLKRNAIGILMGVELVLNAANVNLVALNRYAHGGTGGAVALDGQIFAVFIIVLAAAEAAVGGPRARAYFRVLQQRAPGPLGGGRPGDLPQLLQQLRQHRRGAGAKP